MLWKKILRIFFISLAAVLGLVLLFGVFSIAPVDRMPAREHPSYARTLSKVDSISNKFLPRAAGSISAGFAKTNITPGQPLSLAGYGKRKGALFTTVHDSVYVRAIVVGNGAQKAAIVSADLLIIPPAVTTVLARKLPQIGFSLDNTYLGATHTHNSIGNWGEGATQFLYGSFEDSVVHFIADKIVDCIKIASSNLAPARIRSGTVAVPQAAGNRLIKDGPYDPLLRAIEIERSDNTKLVMLSFTAHATCLYSRDLELSRDYPGVLVDTLERKGYTFAMFLAGAVGSHKCVAPALGWECTQWVGNELATAFLNARNSFSTTTDSTVAMVTVPLALSDPQVKLSRDWKIRSWLFRRTFHEYPVYISALRIGKVVLLGTPCDFSGEFNPRLDSVASRYGLNAVITSFNGGYIGYVTPQQYYDLDHYETQLMNWYAPGTGEYIEQCLEKLIVGLDE